MYLVQIVIVGIEGRYSLDLFRAGDKAVDHIDEAMSGLDAARKDDLVYVVVGHELMSVFETGEAILGDD